MARLWYLRKGERVTGPFPLPAIQQDFLLGRIRLNDELSQDRQEWLRLSDHPELAALGPPAPRDGGEDGERDWGRERFEALRRWADERSGHDRRAQQQRTTAAQSARRQGERRQPESDRRTVRSTDRPAPSAQPRAAWRVLAAILAVVILALIAVAYHYGTVVPVPVRIG
jgi:hypothetical protein